MPQYRHKPTVVNAHQVPPYGADAENFVNWMIQMNIHHLTESGPDEAILLKTSHGEVFAGPGDWVIIDKNGLPYPCPNDIFQMSYEEVK